jgi:predicted dehydrogenase
MTRLRIGLIGCGRIARLTHLHAIRQSPKLDLVAVADPDKNARTVISSRMKGVAAYAAAEELVRHDGIQAVLIATPPASHVPIALRAIEAGLHVYLEKPMACSVAESRKLLTAWRNSGLVGMVGFNQRAHPLMERAHSLIRSGRIGTPALVRSVFSAAQRQLPDWKQKRDSGGGVLLDLASHHLDLLPWLLDASITSISASVSSRVSDDDGAILALRFENGLEGQVAVSMIGSETDRVEIIGDAGALIIDRFGRRLELRTATRARSRRERVSESLKVLVDSPGRVWAAAHASADPSYRLSLGRFAEAVARGRPVSPDFDEGHKNMIILEAAAKSAKNDGRFESVERSPEGAKSDHPAMQNSEAHPDIEASVASAPELSVVLVASTGFGSVSRVVQYLTRQTITASIELILIGPSREVLSKEAQPWASRFHSIQVLEDRHITNVDVAAALGIRAARAPVVATVEDHAYPDPNWAAAILRAHGGPYVAVGSTFRNANPSSLLSWANLLLSYGEWSEPVTGGETTSISRHNVSYKKRALTDLEDLEQLFGRGGALFDKLRRNGGKFYLASDAIVEHVNFSRLIPTLWLRVGAARLSAARRASKEKWTVARRAIYVVGGVLIPLLRARLLVGKVLAPLPHISRAKLALALLLGCVLDAAGQVIGFALGAGKTAERLADAERHRERFLTNYDRSMLAHGQASAS